MKFRVKCGIHSEAGTIYQAGDIVDSPIDLIKAFNNNGKFERVTVPVDEIESSVNFDSKDEVTDQFKGCKEMNLRVYNENGQYFVVDCETNQPVHETKLTAKETVRTVLEGLK